MVGIPIWVPHLTSPISDVYFIGLAPDQPHIEIIFEIFCSGWTNLLEFNR